MNNIDDQINQAMEEWDKETNCGETDPSFQGDVGQEIDALVDGLKPTEIEKLLAEDNPLIFVDSDVPLYGYGRGDFDTQYVSYDSVTYFGKAVYDRETGGFTIYDNLDNAVCRLEYKQAEMLTHLFAEIERQKNQRGVKTRD